MFDRELTARSHFTSKEDSRAAFYDFAKRCSLLKHGLQYEFDSGLVKNGKRCMFVAESWGGYDAGHGVWVVFASWRCAATKTTRYARWDWDDVNLEVHNMRWNEWVS